MFTTKKHVNVFIRDIEVTDIILFAARCMVTTSNGNFVEISDARLLRQPVTIRDIQDAASRIHKYVHKTPVMTSQRLDKMSGKKLFFKCELLQRTGSFKVYQMSKRYSDVFGSLVAIFFFIL